MIERATENRTIEFSMGILFFYMVWWVDFQHTKYCTSMIVYVSFVALLLLFLYTFLSVVNMNGLIIKRTAVLPSLFLVYTIFGNLIGGDYEYMVYKVVCLLVLIIATNTSDFHKIPQMRIFLSYSILGVIGIGVQMFALPFYNSVIAPIFTNYDKIAYLGRVGYYNGFFYQWGLAAAVLAYGIGVLLFLPTKFSEKRMIRIILYLLFIFAIFSTGKRSLSILVIIVPLFVELLSQRKTSKRITTFLVLLMAALFLIWLLGSSNIKFGISALDRLSDTIKSFMAGGDLFDSARIEFDNKAIELYKTSPIFGIGANRFKAVSGVGTDAHNAYLQVLCEQGLVGLFLLIIGIVSSLISIISRLRNEQNIYNQKILRFALYIQIFFFMNSFSENELINLCGFMMYYISIALCESISNEQQKRSIGSCLDTY